MTNVDPFPVYPTTSILEIVNAVAQRGWQLAEAKLEIRYVPGASAQVFVVKK